MSDKILRAALIGVGNMGKKYVQMIVSGIQYKTNSSSYTKR